MCLRARVVLTLKWHGGLVGSDDSFGPAMASSAIRSPSCQKGAQGSIAALGSSSKRATGFEPATLSLGS